MGERAVPHVRKFLGQRLRELRKQHGFSQERLGERSSLSGKFIGEVERGEKSISVDSLYHVSVALELEGDWAELARRFEEAGALAAEPSRKASHLFRAARIHADHLPCRRDGCGQGSPGRQIGMVAQDCVQRRREDGGIAIPGPVGDARQSP